MEYVTSVTPERLIEIFHDSIQRDEYAALREATPYPCAGDSPTDRRILLPQNSQVILIAKNKQKTLVRVLPSGNLAWSEDKKTWKQIYELWRRAGVLFRRVDKLQTTGGISFNNLGNGTMNINLRDAIGGDKVVSGDEYNAQGNIDIAKNE